MATLSGGQVVWDLTANLTGLQDGLKEASRIVDDTAQNIGKTFQNVGSKMTNIGKDMSVAITAPITAIGAVAVNFTELAGKYSSVEDAFKSMTQGMGINAKQFQQDVANATGGQIDKLTILQGATRGLALIGKDAFNDFGQDFVKMAELSKKAARATGQDVDFMFNSLVLGISRESKLILDNLGVSIDITKAKELYAQQLGKTSEELTQSEQKHAVLNTVLGQLEQTYGNVAVSAGGFSGASQQLNTIITDARIEIGKELEPTLAKLTKDLSAIIKDVLPTLIKLIKGVVDWFTNLSPTMQKIIIGVILLVTVLGPVLVVFGVWITAVGGIITAIGALLPIAGALIGAIMSISAPVWIVIGVIVALIAIGVLLYKNWDFIKVKAYEVFNAVSQAVMSFYYRVRDNIQLVINGFRSLPDRIRSALHNLADVITRPFRDAWDSVTNIVRRIKEELENINPFHRNSPSLVDNVIAGVREIKKQYASMAGIAVPEISTQSLPAIDTSNDEFGNNFSRKNVTVNIGEVRNAQDIDMISREIGYRLALI